MNTLVAIFQPLVRHALRLVLDQAFPNAALHEAASLDQVEQRLAEQRIDLLVIGLRVPGLEGPPDLGRLRDNHPTTRILVLTDMQDRGKLLDCLAAGVHGYVTHLASLDELRRAVNTVMMGDISVPRFLAELPVPVMSPVTEWAQVGATDAGLTPRQIDVLRLLAIGCCNKEIARRLGLGLGTVKVHLARAYHTLGARSRLEAIVKSGVSHHTAAGALV